MSYSMRDLSKPRLSVRGAGDAGAPGGLGFGVAHCVAGHWDRPRDIEHGPDELAALRGGQNPEAAGEDSDNGEPATMQAMDAIALTWQGGAVISNGQAQSPTIPGDGQVNIGTGTGCRAGHELADHQACEGDDPAQSPVQQGARDEVTGGALGSWVRGQGGAGERGGGRGGGRAAARRVA